MIRTALFLSCLLLVSSVVQARPRQEAVFGADLAGMEEFSSENILSHLSSGQWGIKRMTFTKRDGKSICPPSNYHYASPGADIFSLEPSLENVEPAFLEGEPMFCQWSLDAFQNDDDVDFVHLMIFEIDRELQEISEEAPGIYYLPPEDNIVLSGVALNPEYGVAHTSIPIFDSILSEIYSMGQVNVLLGVPQGDRAEQ